MVLNTDRENYSFFPRFVNNQTVQEITHNLIATVFIIRVILPAKKCTLTPIL